jgi:ribose transport system substrate-binding protein
VYLKKFEIYFQETITMANSKGFTRRDFLKGTVLGGGGLFAANMLALLEYRRAQGQDAPLRAAMSNAGLAASCCAHGQEAAMYWAGLLGVEITWFDGELDPAKQRAKFDQIATEEWDFVAVQPNSIDILVEPIQALIDAGTPVIGMDTLIAPFEQQREMGILSFIAPDNVFMAAAAMNLLVTRMGGTGKISHLGGQPGHTGAQARGQGFLSIASRYPDIEIVDDQPANWNLAEAAQITESVLNRHPDLNAIFADNDDMALAARQVVDNAGLGDQVIVGGVDAMPAALEAISDGRLLVSARNPSCRIHGWSVVAGALAATVGLEQARQEIPFYILADGPAITGEVDANPEFADAPWKLTNYGMSPIEGVLWLEEHYLL